MTPLDEILEEIDRLAGTPEIQPGDITVAMLEEMWHRSESAIRRRMDKLVECGKFTTHLVYDPETARQVRIWRKIDDD